MTGIKPLLLEPAVVAVPGTPVPFSADHMEFQSLMIQADPDNTGNVMVGDEAGLVAGYGIILTPGEKMGIDGIRREPGNDGSFLDEWFVDAENADDTIRIINLVRR